MYFNNYEDELLTNSIIYNLLKKLDPIKLGDLFFIF